jgi:anti-sigma28 factor (negative regulator of flagellin synthesis)
VATLVTKGPFLWADDATLKSGMNQPDNPSKVNPFDPADEKAIDEERLKKIATLKQAVADGTYHVSPEELADKLIEHMLEPKS